MTIQEQQRAAREFAQRWNGRGYEKGEGQIFWCELLQEVFGVSRASDFITFEAQVKLDHTSFIDGFIDSTKVMIEQKSLGKNLKAGIVQSDGSVLSPFQQAKRYAAELPYSKRPRWIVTCNFAEFLVYDMEQPNGEPYHIALEDLEKEYYRLQFLVDTGKEHLRRELEVSKKAGEIIGVIYDKLLERYINPTAPETLHSLNMLCVRLVFCLYAEDAGVFGSKQQFGDYIKRFEARDVRRALLDLFRVLDQKPAERDPYLDEELAAFPYVNGGLFSVEDTAIPQFTDELKNLLCRKASDDFDWSEISPTIFGAIFESTLNPETRRSGGMHYTSIENIHKVIDPLFLDELEGEFEAIQGGAASLPRSKSKESSTIVARQGCRTSLQALHSKLASLTFLDPACGSGNFLTETYISLRRLENKIISALNKGQSVIGFNADYSPVKVGIHQFYGIEINDFAVTVARTALWIAEHQMLRETQAIVAHDLDFLPLKSYNNIIEGNALTVDWAYLTQRREDAKGITPTGCNSIAQCETLGTDSTPSNHPVGVQQYNTISPLQGHGEDGQDTQRSASLHTGLYNATPSGLHFDYIMGNPPFVGTKYQSAEQKADILALCPQLKMLDYVTGWYYKAAQYMQETQASLHANCQAGSLTSLTKCAFVSTNSITQGEQVAPLWKVLDNVKIDFAYRTFRWDSESSSKAHVHCVIIGFSAQCAARTSLSVTPQFIVGSNAGTSSRAPRCTTPSSATNIEPYTKVHDDREDDAYHTMNRVVKDRAVSATRCLLYDESGNAKQVEHINGYLIAAPDVCIDARSKPLCPNAPKMSKGSQPTDGGNLLLDEEEKNMLLAKYPTLQPYIKQYMGANDLLNNIKRYCLWLVNANPTELRKIPEIVERIEGVRQSRLASPKAATRKWADYPTVFTENRQPESDYLILPVVSSERRRYMPICYVSKDVIANANAQMIPNADLYTFGVLMSNVHNAWMRAVCGRLETRYAYSATIVYNNFPWCEVTEAQRAKIERTAQGILDARAKYPDCSLADLYDERFMPADLRKAHRENDRAVMEAYGFTVGMTESECVARLMEMYKEMTK